MFEMKIKTEGIPELLNFLDSKNVRKAIRNTINDTLFELKGTRKKEGTLVEAMAKRFDRPRMSFLRRAFRVEKASDTKLQGSIALRDDSLGKGSRFIDVYGHHFTGGERPEKRFELALQHFGIIGKHERVVMGKYMPKDQYGNFSAGFYTKLMSYLRLHWKAGYAANMTDYRRSKVEKKKLVKYGKGKNAPKYMTYKGKAYFIITKHTLSRGGRFKSHLHPGIYEKTGIHGFEIKPVLLFVSKAVYKKIFDIDELANRLIDKEEFQAKLWKNYLYLAKRKRNRGSFR
ncbi:hypothetical protein [Deferribacter abyssi]|uniref:hypothetical protein n=1 Tax=Deferribacter abyssi TaxID=213806 RepID=UPI003C1BD8B6